MRVLILVFRMFFVFNFALNFLVIIYYEKRISPNFQFFSSRTKKIRNLLGIWHIKFQFETNGNIDWLSQLKNQNIEFSYKNIHRTHKAYGFQQKKVMMNKFNQLYLCAFFSIWLELFKWWNILNIFSCADESNLKYFFKFIVAMWYYQLVMELDNAVFVTNCEICRKNIQNRIIEHNFNLFSVYQFQFYFEHFLFLSCYYDGGKDDIKKYYENAHGTYACVLLLAACYKWTNNNIVFDLYVKENSTIHLNESFRYI